MRIRLDHSETRGYFKDRKREGKTRLVWIVEPLFMGMNGVWTEYKYPWVSFRSRVRIESECR